MALQRYIGNHSDRSGNTSYRKNIGRWAEDLVCKKLLERGYEIKARNLHCPLGEIDIVAWDGKRHLLIEVRCKRVLRNSQIDGWDLLSLCLPKRKLFRLRGLYNYYSMYYPSLRFDFALVLRNKSLNRAKILYFKNVFRYFE